MALDGIHGQDAAVQILRRALAGGRIAHAYAFVGPPGSGRRRTAVAFAQALVAPRGGPAADRVERGAHPDVRLVQATPPEQNPKGPLAVRIESIRDLERLAALRPSEGGWKVFIVDDADRMTAATPQAFLKTLEEPPARTVIILILTHLRALPATVISRCQIVRFHPAHGEGTVALLPAGAGAARAQALAWLGETLSEGAQAIFRAGEAVGRDRQAGERAVETWWLFYRDALCARGGGGPALRVLRECPPLALEHAARLSVEDIVGRLDACREAWHAIQGNVTPRSTVEVLLSRLGEDAQARGT